MKDIALVTDIPFWHLGLGRNRRIQELCDFLAVHSRFTCYYLGDQECPLPNAFFEPHDKELQLKAHLEKARHELLIVEYIHLHWIVDLCPKETQVYLDAHDLLSDRKQSFASFNRPIHVVTFDEEIDYFRKFDKVLFMQKEELEKVAPILGIDHLLLCPHPITPEGEAPLRQKVEAISFLGSPSWPNIDSLQWFHDTVIPLMGNWAQKCIVNGTMSDSPLLVFLPQLTQGKIFFSLDDYYKSIDIAINPALYGSGLKIKTIEALAYGVPLVTTSVGAQGVREENGRSFLIADTSEQFAQALCTLAESLDLRRELSRKSRLFARQYLTPDACFGSLLK